MSIIFWCKFDCIFITDVPPGERPPPARNLNISQEAGGWVLRWEGPGSDGDSDDSEGAEDAEGTGSNGILYYAVEKRKDKDDDKDWQRIADNIDVKEASYMSKCLEYFEFLARKFKHSNYSEKHGGGQGL